MSRDRTVEYHWGRVLSNQDPENQGGLKVRVDTIFEGGALFDDFIPPTFPFAGKGDGFFFVPEPGSQVRVEVTSNPSRSIESLEARWVAVTYDTLSAIPPEFTSNPTQRGGIKFGSNVMLFDKASSVLALISSNVRLGVEDASHPVVRGDVLNTQMIDNWVTAMDTMLTTLNTAWTALAALPPGPLSAVAAAAAPVPPAIAAFKAAIASFKSAKNTWLSTKVKTE